MREALDIHVSGIVQGVGFRPFVYRLAKHYLIDGWVLNAKDGVHIHAEGDEGLLGEFVMEISENAPAAAHVKEIDIDQVPLQDCTSFEIRFSEDDEDAEPTLVSPDLATCDDCVVELFDPKDRRYHYPFINCTNCGPRFTIVDELPYDRKTTSMSAFPMCETCAQEYADPADRRFHAQPDACFDCGPHISWKVAGSDEVRWGDTREHSDEIIAEAARMIEQGKIVALKGLGGFHLACDGSNPDALERLRTRKHRGSKPFAVMMRDAKTAASYCMLSKEEAGLLECEKRPITLLRKKPGARFAEGLADSLPELGVMLPATPLQHLLMHEVACDIVVMTSGNVADQPIEIDDEHAYVALDGVADAFLGNNRAIRSRYDDSVVRMLDAGAAGLIEQVIRRARGMAPQPLECAGVQASRQLSGVFATGPEQKCTFTLMRAGEAFVSAHIGDMEDAATNDAWLQSKETYQKLFGVEPAVIACDKHPEYLTSKWAASQDLPVVGVQHHHAHIVSAMAENGLEGPVCGIAFDGTGYGEDGAIWGGEALLANLQAFERFANFAYFPLPGGAAAIKHPLKCAYGALWAFDLLDHPAAIDALAPLGEEAQVLESLIDGSINCPQTSSVGRLFDAASALLGICVEPTYEGEAAVLLEAAIDAQASEDLPEAWQVEIVKNVATQTSTAVDTSVILLDAAPVFQALLDDLSAGVSKGVIARRFHDAISNAIVSIAQLVGMAYGINTIVLAGGVFMNRYLVERTIPALLEAGCTVALNRELPPNDAGVSFGQAVVAWQTENDAAASASGA